MSADAHRSLIEFQKFEIETQSRELQEYTRQLQDSRDRYRELYDEAPIGYLTLDPQGRILDCNRTAAVFFELDASRLMGQSLQRWVHGSDRQKLEAHLFTDSESEEETLRTLELQLVPIADGRPILVQLQLRAVRSPTTGQRLFRTAFMDITDRKRAEEAEAANRSKSMFLANMSHEIRTPLGAILGFVEFLRDPKMPADKRDQCIEVIRRNGAILTRVIDDILDLSKVEADRLDVERAAFSLPALLGELAEVCGLKAREKSLGFAILQRDVPAQVTSDPIRLRQILLNIVGNAIKFTDRGEVTVTVDSSPSGTGRRSVTFVVRDTGSGIPPAQRARLFQNFSQADSSITRKFGGTGLGLVLARKLARALGGDVTLEDSGTSGGSVFRVVIDVEVDETATLEPRHVMPARYADREAERSGQLSGTRVLVVEDSPDNQLLIQHLMSQWGVQTEFADDGIDGVKNALSRDYDLVLMDVQMPRMDGHTATRKLRRQGFRKPIIALSAHAMKEDRDLSLQAGCNSHLTKPINPAALAETLQKFVAGRAH